MTYQSNSDAKHAGGAGAFTPSIISQKSCDKTNKYLDGLKLPRIKNMAEERAAKNAWDAHDVASSIPVIGTLVATVVAIVAGGVLSAIFVPLLGVLMILIIAGHDGRRVMANAVLDVRDKERPSLINEEERQAIEDTQS